MLWLLVLALPSLLQAAPRPMRFEHLSIEEGLSQSVVNCILQDATGFLWFGTQSGLNRYDGYGFTIYRHDPQDPATLANDWILALLEDDSGDLWIGTEGGGLARWRRGSDTFDSYRHDPQDPQSLSGDNVVALARDASGALWVGTRDSGLNRFAGAGPGGAGGSFRRYRHDPEDPQSLPSDNTFTLYVDRAGDLWVGTTGGLGLFDPARDAFVRYRHDPGDPSSLSDDRVRAILEDSSGRLWIGSHGGLNLFDRAAPGRAASGRAAPGRAAPGRFERFLHDPSDPASLSHDWVRYLFEDADGRLWVGTDGGLSLWREQSGGFDVYRADSSNPRSLSSDQLVTIYQDRSRILWIGTIAGGLNRWNPGTWSFPLYAGDGAGPSSTVFAVTEDGAGALWIGTLGGLERLDRATGGRVRYRHAPADPSSLSDDRVTALLLDRAGDLWVGTVGGGLNRLPGEGFAAGAFQRHRRDASDPTSLPADAVAALLEDRQGRLWVGTITGGLARYLGDGAFQSYRHDPEDPTSLSSDRILSLAEDAGGRLWLATDGGLARFHPLTEAFLRFEHDPAVASSLSSNELQAVHVDAAGRLWIGTRDRGLDRLESLDEATGLARFRNYSRAEGLPDTQVWGIRSEAGGGLWIATNNGLARLDPASGAVKTYDVSHGLQSNEFNLGAHFQSAGGELFFGGVGGLNAFYPERLEAPRYQPPVVLTAVTRVDQPMTFAGPTFDVGEIALGHRDYALSLEFAALDYAAGGRSRYRYQLEGLDATWIDNDLRRWVSFTNLDPGRYLLRVQAAGSTGEWSEHEARIRIAVAPPPWRSWWAYALYAFGLAALAGGAALIYAQHQEVVRERAVAAHERERVQERERLIEERERLAEERERLHAELAESNAELEGKNAELERFNYTVTHDLKSPLVTIKGFLGMLERDIGLDDRERVEHDIARVNAAADKMKALLDELLDLARAGDQAQGRIEDVALADLAGEALELIEGLTRERGVVVEIDPGLPVVQGDPVRLLQVYQNLLANAVQYMGEEEAPRIEVGMRRRERAAGPAQRVFFVRDNGMGIDPRFHAKVFGLFERLEVSKGGTGVGLAVVKRIVDSHGGRVWVESDGEGRGSTFCFTLGAEAEG